MKQSFTPHPDKAKSGESFTESDKFKSTLEPLRACEPATLLDSISDPSSKEFLYQVLSATGAISLKPDDKRPPWALQAWREFIRSTACLPKEPVPDVQLLGHYSGLVSEIGPQKMSGQIKLPDALNILADLMPQIREIAAQASPTEAAAFFDAQKTGQAKASQLGQVSQRTKIYLVIAVRWQKVAAFKSTAELFQWLKADDKNGHSLLAPGTDSREIRAVCKIIGLRYPTRGGRPSKKTGL